MLRLIALTLRQTAQPFLVRGRSALVEGATIAGLAVAGGVLVLAAAVLWLAQRVGPVNASGLTGLALLGIAGLMARRHCHQTVQEPAPPRGSADQDQALATLGFVFGFVISRAMSRRIGRRQESGPKGRGS